MSHEYQRNIKNNNPISKPTEKPAEKPNLPQSSGQPYPPQSSVKPNPPQSSGQPYPPKSQGQPKKITFSQPPKVQDPIGRSSSKSLEPIGGQGSQSKPPQTKANIPIQPQTNIPSQPQTKANIPSQPQTKQPIQSQPKPQPPSAPNPSKQMLVRVMTREGILRLDTSGNWTINDLTTNVASKVKTQASIIKIMQKPGSQPLNRNQTLFQLGISHGDLLYSDYPANIQSGSQDDPLQAPKEFYEIAHREKILIDYDCGSDSSGDESTQFGTCNHPSTMKCTRCIKSNRYVEAKPACQYHSANGTCSKCINIRPDQRIAPKRQEKHKCKHVYVNESAFQAVSIFAQKFGKMYKRIGYLYGRETKDKDVEVEFIYEPPQLSKPEGVGLLPDPQADIVAKIVKALKMKIVGWIFSHEPRLEELTPLEMIQAGKYQIEHGHRFVTLSCTIPGPVPVRKKTEKQLEKEKEEGYVPPPVTNTGEGDIQPYQVSMQFTRIIRRGIVSSEQTNDLEVMMNEDISVELKERRSMPVEFGIVNIPIKPLKSRFTSKFPIENRPDFMASDHDLKFHMKEAQRNKISFVDALSDFHLLLFLTKLMDHDTVIQITEAVEQGSFNNLDGLVLMVKSLADID